jgi:prepilin-type N-terminal cleavage/methylation domain-containing protein/prepilin-type processing-associated H-X9-DG protein
MRKGITLVEVVVVIAIITILIGLTTGAVMKVRESANRTECANNLRQLSGALHSYHQCFGILPPGAVKPPRPHVPDPQLSEVSKGIYPRMTWHMRILPYIEQQPLWNQIVDAYRQDFYVTRNPPHSAGFESIPLFICPTDGQRTAPAMHDGPVVGTTSYLGVSGTTWFRDDGLFYTDSRIRFTDIKDGTSNTIAVGERPASLDLRFGVWHGFNGLWQNVTVYLGAREIVKTEWNPACEDGPAEFKAGSLNDPCSVYHYWSFHPGGGQFLFADGSVHFLSYSAAPILPALATRAGGETVSIPE